MIGWRFSDYEPGDLSGSPFERLLKMFQDLLVYTCLLYTSDAADE